MDDTIKETDLGQRKARDRPFRMEALTAKNKKYSQPAPSLPSNVPIDPPPCADFKCRIQKRGAFPQRSATSRSADAVKPYMYHLALLSLAIPPSLTDSPP